MKGLKQILKGRTGPFFARLLGKKEPSAEEWKAFSETVFRCTLCGNCQEVCPVGHSPQGPVAFPPAGSGPLQGSYPKKIRHDPGQPRREPQCLRGGQRGAGRLGGGYERMRPDHGFVKERAEVVYFTGCVAAYFPLAQKIPVALAEILDVERRGFHALGRRGVVLRVSPAGGGPQGDVEHLRRTQCGGGSEERGARRVVFACPSCYQMWREHYPIGVRDRPCLRVPDGLVRARQDPSQGTGPDRHLPRPLRPGPRGAGVRRAEGADPAPFRASAWWSFPATARTANAAGEAATSR